MHLRWRYMVEYRCTQCCKMDGRAMFMKLARPARMKGREKRGHLFSRCASRMGFRLGNGAIRLLESLGFSPLRQPT